MGINMNNVTLTISNRVKVPYLNEALDDFIYNSLTFLNPKWIENKRMKRFNWDTPKELTFYEEEGSDDLYVPRGFLVDIAQYCKKNNISFKINNQTYKHKNINWKFSGTLKPFQKIAVKKMLSADIGTLCSPTGSGKTVMGLYMIAARKQTTLILVHTRELLAQWNDRIFSFLNINKNQIGQIGGGKIDENKNIAVGLIQTLRNYPEIIDKYSYLMIDEAHRTPSKTHTDIVSQFKGRYITGLSATPFRNDKLDKVIQWYAGPILHEIKQRELIETGDIMGIQSIIRKTNFNSQIEDPSKAYTKLLQEISFDKERNLMIANDIMEAVANGETCLVLSDRKIHCQELQDCLEKQGMASTVLTGDTHITKREQIVKDVNAGKIKILIATGQLIGEGFDCKNLSCLFLTMPIRYSGRIIQYIGRVLRPMAGKDKATIYDYFDHSVKCLHGGMRGRKKEYKKLEV